MAIRTTITRTTRRACAPSADANGVIAPAGFLFSILVAAYYDCRRHKRNTRSALAFEVNLERNLVELYDQLVDGTYSPGRSICFVVTHPKPREVWAADFRDRIVHHLLYNHISPAFHAGFIADSCACIPGRGTLYAAKRLEAKIRSATQNWSRPQYYLKCDIANFFVSIDKRILRAQLAERIDDPWWLHLAELVLLHDPRENFELRGSPEHLSLVPPHKRLVNQSPDFGLPIGNLSSQFFANIFLDALDQFAKHRLRAKHYIRYVDDFILLHESPQWLNAALIEIDEFLQSRLGVQLNPAKTILQPVDRGVDFVGHVIKPWRRTTRRRTRDRALQRIEAAPNSGELFEIINSYFGLFGQASHSHGDRAALANAALRHGRTVDFGLSKSYRPKLAGRS